ncbi:hypothetical protein NMG60_11034305 [Bertholletia excelsa]
MNHTMICLLHKEAKSRGIFFGDNPLNFAGPVLLVQISLSASLAGLLQYFLTPLGETAFVSQTLVGLALGPSFLGKFEAFSKTVFPAYSFYLSETFAYFGLMLFLFLVGVKMDITMIRKSGKSAVVVGLCNFFIPLFLNQVLAFFLLHSVPMDPLLHHSVPWVSSLQCLSSFYVISCLLADLKLLNSDVGRLAVSASMISGICSWSWSIILFTTKQNVIGGNQNSLVFIKGIVPVPSLAFTNILCHLCHPILRPLMLWMVRRTGEGKAVKESYIFGIFMMMLGCAMFGEIIGQHFLIGPMVLGLAVPVGPPLGTALVEKLESFVSSILLPIFFVVSGTNLDFSSIRFRTFSIVELLGFCGFLWKVIGTTIASLYFEMSVKDAVALALIMSVQGITELVIIARAKNLQYIDKESYCVMYIMIVVITAIVTPIVKALYNPSKKYIAYRRRTILHARMGDELRLLACIYYQDQAPSIINLLRVSNSNPKNPIFFYLVHLMELSGRSAPVLVAHHPGRRSSIQTHESDHIINAFRLYEEQSMGTVMVSPFTAISPYATMHDEVCALALDRRVSMVIIPFHRYLTFDGTVQTANPVRAVNRNILRMAPCSVGILVDRGILLGQVPQKDKSLCNVGLIFIGGQDDREALAYAGRMANHPDVMLTVVRLTEYPSKKYKLTQETEQDLDLINEFRAASAKNACCIYREEVVSDGVGVASVVKELENSFELILAGRRHDGHAQLLAGLSDWNEFPELGYIGDMLVSSDSSCTASVLVVQQQAFSGGGKVDYKHFIRDLNSLAVDIPPRRNVAGTPGGLDMPPRGCPVDGTCHRGGVLPGCPLDGTCRRGGVLQGCPWVDWTGRHGGVLQGCQMNGTAEAMCGLLLIILVVELSSVNFHSKIGSGSFLPEYC